MFNRRINTSTVNTNNDGEEDESSSSLLLVGSESVSVPKSKSATSSNSILQSSPLKTTTPKVSKSVSYNINTTTSTSIIGSPGSNSNNSNNQSINKRKNSSSNTWKQILQSYIQIVITYIIQHIIVPILSILVIVLGRIIIILRSLPIIVRQQHSIILLLHTIQSKLKQYIQKKNTLLLENNDNEKNSNLKLKSKSKSIISRYITYTFLIVFTLFKCYCWITILVSVFVPFLVLTPNSSTSNTEQQNRQQQRQEQQNQQCTFRQYEQHRYYHLKDTITKSLPFLSSATEYIYGQWPIILDQKQSTSTSKLLSQKICVNQSSWLPSISSRITTTNLMNDYNVPLLENNNNNNNKQEERKVTTGSTNTNPTSMLPFADGTNPSIVTIERIQQYAPDVASIIVQNYPTTVYIITICMTNSQCVWNTNTSTTQAQTTPDTVRTILQLLDSNLLSLYETTIYFIKNSPYGVNNKSKKKRLQNVADTKLQRTILPLDDCKLFIYNSQLYITYREGPTFGYETQVINPLHIQFVSSSTSTDSTNTNTNKEMIATIFASETSSLCCGRNMALLTSSSNDNANNLPTTTSSSSTISPILRALTWVDPVTVIIVNTTTHLQQQQTPASEIIKQPTTILNDLQNYYCNNNNNESQDLYSILSDVKQQQIQNHRRLAGIRNTNSKQTKQQQNNNKQHKSHIHGTNGFMVYLQQTDEYIGIAHFHRPNDRSKNIYAKFGHHYTHAFYTIQEQQQANISTTSTTTTDFVLTGLSNEFLLPSTYEPNDGHIIQFISGLEYNQHTNQFILSYGINDCEGAITIYDYDTIRSLLIPTGNIVNNNKNEQQQQQQSLNKQVVDFMKVLKN